MPPPVRPTRREPRTFLVKLEYMVKAWNPHQAVDALAGLIRETGFRRSRGVIPTAELLRTDVRRPGEAGEW